ncbi:unnamed protein product [Dibothriocephalus latus]|uniref:Protein UNC80 C-terminal domain-containing protein n=1 Tax=Dibothriocephalus latus TaxID=60516 RepID=A0A3P7P2S8_DIBLA|nr:unnamed protein product [Dibothriocephalus latus]
MAFLGLKLILVVYSRHSLARVRQINAVLAKLTFYRSCAAQLWKFVDFMVTYRPSIFVHLVPFIRFQMMNINCETQGEQAFQQIIGQKLLGLHVPPQPTIVSLVKDLLLDLRVLQEEKRVIVFFASRYIAMVSD